MSGFREVVPGVMVNTDSRIKISIPHPDPCWIIRDAARENTMTVGGRLAVFSGEVKAHAFMTREPDGSHEQPDGSYVLEKMSWDELVDQYSERFPDTLVDHRGVEGFYSVVPLQKGI